MQHAQSIDTVKPRGSIRQGAGYATAPGFARCLSPEREHSDPQTANRVRQGAACAAPYILSTVSTRTQKTPRFASERLFGVVLHSESPERNAMSACIHVCRSRTERPQAFGIAGLERLVSMLSRVPGSNAVPAGIRVYRSQTERPQTRQNRLRREATRSPAGWERCTREPRSLGQDRRAPWHRCRTASCATPASRRCPLPPAAPQ